MRFAVYVHDEKVPSFAIDAKTWPEALKTIAGEIERRAGSRISEQHLEMQGQAGSSGLQALTIRWLWRQ